jgi:hypothetical protein
MKLIASSLISLSVLVGISAPASAIEDVNEKNTLTIQDANDKSKVAVEDANEKNRGAIQDVNDKNKKTIQDVNERLNSRAFNPQPDPPGKVAPKYKSHESNPIGTKQHLHMYPPRPGTGKTS